MNVANCKR